MRTLFVIFFLVFSTTSCQEYVEEHTVSAGNDAVETRAADSGSTDYYWYNGEKIYLTRSEKYVNVITYSKLVKSSKTEMAANSLTGSGQTKILPFFERGEGIEPIGTSDIFYLKLKAPEDITLLENLAGGLGVRVIEEIPHTPCWYTLSILGSEFDRGKQLFLRNREV